MGAGQRGSGCRVPIPGQQLADTIDRMVGDACEDIAQIGLRIASVHPCRLCRLQNYAEQVRFPQDSS
jgi:hypothetical protein